MTEGLDDLLGYYRRELAYLRDAGGHFAKNYPKVAARLELWGGESPDPHVERLIECFAFLTARLQRTLDADFPEIPTALLSVLYPHLVAPVPSLAVAQFQVDAGQARAAAGFRLESGLRLFAEAQPDGQSPLTCRFRTVYPVTLWPLAVTEASCGAPRDHAFYDRWPTVASVVRLKLSCVGSAASLAQVQPQTLRFHLHGNQMVTAALYEMLFNRLVTVAVLPEGASEILCHLPPESVRAVGFGEDEALLPVPAHAHRAYALVQEYFTFPAKFLFFDVVGLPPMTQGKSFELLFMMTGGREPVGVDADTFQLGCTPIINLFPQTSEPVRLDHTRTDYRLVGDYRWERATEIHSVAKVSATANGADEATVYQPYYSFDHAAAQRRERAFWIARREPTGRPDLPGSDVLLSFVDLDFTPAQPADRTIFAHTLCTNRDLANHLPPGARLHHEEDAPVAAVQCLGRPTPQINPPAGGDTLWRLVSQLSLNHLSLCDGPAGAAALREMLTLYCGSHDEAQARQIAGIRSVTSRRIVRRVGAEAWRGFCRGLEVTLEIDEDEFVGSSAFLLTAVLARVFGLYTAVDSFTQLVVKRRNTDGVWTTWPPLAGAIPVL